MKTDSEVAQKSHFNRYVQFIENYDKIKSYASKIYYIDDKLFKKKK